MSNVASILSRNALAYIPVKLIQEEVVALRVDYDEEALEELGESVNKKGLLQPIIVAPTEGRKYELIIGSRRLRSAKRRNEEKLPAIVIERQDPLSYLLMALAENLQREDLNVFEEARAFLRLMKDHGLSAQGIARHTSKSEAYVRQRMELLSLPQGIQQLVADKVLGLHHVDLLARLPDEESQLRYAAKAVHDGLSKVELRELIYQDVENEPALKAGTRRFTAEKVRMRLEVFSKWVRKLPHNEVLFRSLTEEDKEKISKSILNLSTQLGSLQGAVDEAELVPSVQVVEVPLFLKAAPQLPVIKAQTVREPRKKNKRPKVSSAIAASDPNNPQYYRDVLALSTLSSEEVANLSRRIQEHNDIEARNTLVAHNLRLVQWVAKRFLKSGWSFDDLVQEGTLGLITATEKFDPEKGSFSTYAIWWIRQAIGRGIMDRGDTIRFPVYIKDLHRQILAMSGEMALGGGQIPTAEAIAEKLKISVNVVRKALHALQLHVVSLDTPVNNDQDDGESRGVAEIIADTDAIDPLTSLQAKEELELACEAVNLVLRAVDGASAYSARDKLIFKALYGLDDSREQKTLEEVGQAFNLTRERVRQIAEKAWGILATAGVEMDQKKLREKLRSIEELEVLADTAAQI